MFNNSITNVPIRLTDGVRVPRRVRSAAQEQSPTRDRRRNGLRTRWSAIGAAVAVALGAGGIGLVSASSPASSSAFVPITPCRLVDTRPAPQTVGPRSAPIGADEVVPVQATGVHGECDIPLGAAGLAMNVTALNASERTYLTIYPYGNDTPKAASLNPVPGAPPTPNAVTTGLATGGLFSIYNLAGNVDVVADVVGYYLDADDLYYRKAEVDQQLAGGVADAELMAVGLFDDASARIADVEERLDGAKDWLTVRLNVFSEDGTLSLGATQQPKIRAVRIYAGLYCVETPHFREAYFAEVTSMSFAERIISVDLEGALYCPNDTDVVVRSYDPNGSFPGTSADADFVVSVTVKDELLGP